MCGGGGGRVDKGVGQCGCVSKKDVAVGGCLCASQSVSVNVCQECVIVSHH